MRNLIAALMLTVFVIPAAHANMGKMYKKDANGDGVITRAEMNAYNDKVFNEMDTNKDDKISKAESDAYFKKYGWSGKPGQNEQVHNAKDTNEDNDHSD